MDLLMLPARLTVLLILLIAAGASRPACAKEKLAAEWLDYAAEQAGQIKANDDRTAAESAYLRATLFYRLAILEHRAKRVERAYERMADTQAAIESYLMAKPQPPGPRPAWTYSYLDGPAEVIGWPNLPKRPRDLDELTQLHIDTVHAEALLRSGDVEGFTEHASTLFTALHNLTRGEKTHGSHGIAWQMSYLTRQAKAEDLIYAFAAPRWTDQAEAILTSCVEAQVTSQVGDERVAAFSLDALEKRFDREAPRNEDLEVQGVAGMQYGYRTDWDDCYIELITAASVIHGYEAAREMARKRFGADRSWLFSSTVREAQLYRIFGKPRNKSRGHSALNRALNVRFKDAQYPPPADLAMLGYEAAVRKRAGLLDVFIKRNNDPVVRSYVAMGAAEGTLQSRKR